MGVDIYFSDFFGVAPEILEAYGAFNVSLINDLPLFIDPFLLFNSPDPAYQRLHRDIIDYVKFLKGKSAAGPIEEGLLRAWFTFPEVRQNWLGFSTTGNGGHGLGMDFATALDANLRTIFSTFGDEEISKGSHLEKLCLVKDGIGRDNISDFTTNLIKPFLLEYTERFAREHLPTALRRTVSVRKVAFNYATESWADREYELPCFAGDHVILTPKDILTRDEAWINRTDLVRDFGEVVVAVPDDQVRAQINNYFLKLLMQDDTKEGEREAVAKVVEAHPQILDWYIKLKEDRGDQAESQSRERVADTEDLFIEQVKILARRLQDQTGFYAIKGDTYEEAFERVMFLKDIIENKDGYRIFYPKGQPIKKEEQVQILYRLTWRGTPSDVNREVNNGRGPVDVKVSRGRGDSCLVEFKLASNSQLRRNLEHQVKVYEAANDTRKSIKVIVYFSPSELSKVTKILKELGLKDDRSIVLIDACKMTKPSASKAG